MNAPAQAPPRDTVDSLYAAELARDVHYAICDYGLAPLSPTDNARMREAIERVLLADGRVVMPHARKARAGTVADYPDDDMMRRAVRNAVRSKKPSEYAWVRVMNLFGLGSTYAARLCMRFGIDPDTGKDIAPGGSAS